MNILQILQEIEKADPEVYQRLDSRRAVFRHFGGLGKKLAAAAVPMALGAIFNKAYGQTSADVTTTLLLAYRLENLEAEFYRQATSTGAALFPDAAARTAFETIRNQEIAHVNFLKTTLETLGATVPVYSAASFDFSARNTITNTFTSYEAMLGVAQAFEDLGVRAYKGSLATFIKNNEVLTAAMKLHSVEARHAAHIRRMRRQIAPPIPAGSTDLPTKPWITLNLRGEIPSALQAIYNGEEAVNQPGSNATLRVPVNNRAESFDEPLTNAQVTTILTPFFK